MREKKFGKLFLTWLLAATMVLTLLPVSMLAMDAPGEAEDGEAVLTPVAGAEAGETAVPAEAAPMLLATPAAADTPIAVPTDKLFFDKANGVITGIDADWLAENKDKPLSVTIPAEIEGVAVTTIGSQAFQRCNNLVRIDLSGTNIVSIQKRALCECTSLKEVILPSVLTVLGSSVFTDCKHVESI